MLEKILSWTIIFAGIAFLYITYKMSWMAFVMITMAVIYFSFKAIKDEGSKL